MCYSAMVRSDYEKFVREYGAKLSLKNFYDIFYRGQRVLKMMRYHCRPAHVPATFDKEYPGCCNARKDSLKGFWRQQYGHTHGVLIISRFYEHVPKHLAEQRGGLEPGEKPETVVVEFEPEPPQNLAVACIWARWSAPSEPDLYSFAIITDDPPPEILAVGHDRCVVPIRADDIDTWLQPEECTYEQLDAILDPAARPFFRHSLLAGDEPGTVGQEG